MFQDPIVPGDHFILDLQNNNIAICDIVKVSYVRNDGLMIVIQPIDNNILIQVEEQTFRRHAKQRIPVRLELAITDESRGT